MMCMRSSVGVDGCPDGWFCIYRDGGRIRFVVVSTIAELVRRFPTHTVAIDMPIGLPAAGAREVDSFARSCLGPRRSSVFPAPIRPVLNAPDREAASAIGEAVDRRRLSKQSWAILPKIVELDNVLQNDRGLLARIHECHPEVCWTAMNAGVPMRFSKKNDAGREERLELVDAHFGPTGRVIYNAALARYRRSQVARDDILDAFACLWTAERIDSGQARPLLPQPQLDPLDLPMQMVY